MEATDAMKAERESNPSFLSTRLAVMAAILAVGIAGLASMNRRNPVAPPRVATGVTVGLMLKHSAAREEADLIASRARGWGADAVTDASVMWGSFATPATCGERACESPVLPAPGVAARSASSSMG